MPADGWPFRAPTGTHSQTGRLLGRGIGRKLVRRDGTRSLPAIAGAARIDPGGPRATRRSPWARARQHGLGASPRRGGQSDEGRKVVREPARGRRELLGATQLSEHSFPLVIPLALPPPAEPAPFPRR